MEIESIKCSNCGAQISQKIKGKYICSFCGAEFLPELFSKNYSDESKDFEIIGGTLIKYKGDSTSPIIPDSVIKIGAHSFSHCLITDITIPLSVTEIGQYAFEDCVELQSVNIPESVIKIGQRAFVRCFKLDKVDGAANVILTSDDFAGSPFSKTMNQNTSVEYKQEHSRVHNEQHTEKTTHKAGCYVATCVYGSYDCPQLWMLRRYRDFKLSQNFFGKVFIKLYYFASPYIVKKLGNKKWFNNFFRKIIDKKVKKLSELGYSDTPYKDIL